MKQISIKISEDDDQVAYVYLPDHPKKDCSGCIMKSININQVINGYRGPDLILDFNDDGVCIGIEILA